MIKPYKKQPKGYSDAKWHQYEKIIASFFVFDIKEEFQQWILEAMHDELDWDWYADCNGANVVSEPGWKGKFSPPYIRHDYAVGRWGFTIKANREMRQLQRAYGMDGWRSWLRWTGVTFFGMPYSNVKTWLGF